ncbi:endonuclease/exonuclease/phosphatase family protein [Fuerstiella marisgermanici]|uniref:Exodeoxyribonuclease III (Xth) n=1 Tax=Fuerstiella marisgermanici TaxID=1891926 RepID=A0A1P8WR71_9PLAN|nr:endonuclease/exonuclease/phosphatase family protein [Fuerstiella marisgermanici]APZ96560.1 exodeoxyribonuclease III (xth) [Fuerstiella marisgermanici]
MLTINNAPRNDTSPARRSRVLTSFLYAIGLLAITASVSSVQAAPPKTLRVLCYNIHYGQGNDGEYNLQRLADVINKAKPDLVALQEVDVVVERSGKVHQAQELGKLTGLAVRYGPTQHYQGGLYGNAVLTRLPILDVQIQPLPYTAATPELTTYPRAAIAVDVRLPNDKPLRFISTHFQHNVAEDRVAEATAINRLFGDGSPPAILAGDMNATPDSEPIKILEQKWTNAIDEAAAPSAPSSNPQSRIDYVFFRGKSLKLISTEVISEPMASDHCPVLAVFELAEGYSESR